MKATLQTKATQMYNDLSTVLARNDEWTTPQGDIVNTSETGANSQELLHVAKAFLALINAEHLEEVK